MAGMNRIPLDRIPELCTKFSTKYSAIVAIGVPTGCRISEILNLKRSDLIDKKTGKMREVISFQRLKARTGVKTRKMSIPDNLKHFIEKHLNEEAERGYLAPDDHVFRGQRTKKLRKGEAPERTYQLSRLSVYHEFRKVLGSGFGTHWMRKTFAYEMFYHFLGQKDSDPMRALELTRQALGHERIDSTVKYLGIIESDINDAQNAVFGEL